MSIAQILPRAKYFISLVTTDYFEPLPGTEFPPHMLESVFDQQTSPEVGGPPIGTQLYFDLGKTVNTYDANGKRVSVYRLVNYVDGPSTEGASTHVSFYIRTWGAGASYPVTVARIA
jgi:hypothetical protein